MSTETKFDLPPSQLFVDGKWVASQSGKTFATIIPRPNGKSCGRRLQKKRMSIWPSRLRERPLSRDHGANSAPRIAVNCCTGSAMR